ncbi:hypothetical protein HDZ31DRAFT_76726 [Schizophyllum fasciatum]
MAGRIGRGRGGSTRGAKSSTQTVQDIGHPQVENVTAAGRTKRARLAKTPESRTAGLPEFESETPPPKRQRNSRTQLEHTGGGADVLPEQTAPFSDKTLRPRVTAPVPVQPARKPRRTSKQIQADKAERVALEARLLQLEATQRETLAVMEAEQLIADMAQESRAILSLADANHTTVDAGNKDEDDEKMDVEMTSDAMTDLSGPIVNDPQAALDTRILEILAEHGFDLGSSQTKEHESEEISAGAHNPSKPNSLLRSQRGLSSDWRTRITPLQPTPCDVQVDRMDGTEPLGGLADCDADGVAPAPRSASKLQAVSDREVALQRLKSGHRDSSRRNAEVIELSSDIELECTVTPAKAKHKAKVFSHTTVAARTPIKQSTISHAPVKSEPVATTVPAPESVLHDPTRAAMPGFVTAERDIWYGALYAKLFAAQNPFAYRKHVTFVAVVQLLVDELWPSEHYVVWYGDELFEKLVARVGEKRGLIDKAASKVVADAFAQPPYKDNVTKTEAYARWAGRLNGPGLFRVPTPESCTLRKGQPGYIKPAGMFESVYYIDTLRPFLKAYEQAQRVSFGRPIALLGMVAYAIERHFRAYRKLNQGQKVQPGDFSKDNAAVRVMDHMNNVRRFSDRRWDAIYTLCGAEKKEEKEIDPFNEDALDEDRHDLYEPSSP